MTSQQQPASFITRLLAFIGRPGVVLTLGAVSAVVALTTAVVRVLLPGALTSIAQVADPRQLALAAGLVAVGGAMQARRGAEEHGRPSRSRMRSIGLGLGAFGLGVVVVLFAVGLLGLLV